MTDPETRAYLDDYRTRALSTFPLSRVTADFHDQMLEVLPPAYRAGIPGFFVSEALTDNIYAQFVKHCGEHFAAYVDVSLPSGHEHGPITPEKIQAWLTDPANNEKPPVTWYPDF